MPNDEQDKAGAVAPPPLIYVGALVFGLLLNSAPWPLPGHPEAMKMVPSPG